MRNRGLITFEAVKGEGFEWQFPKLENVDRRASLQQHLAEDEQERADGHARVEKRFERKKSEHTREFNSEARKRIRLAIEQHQSEEWWPWPRETWLDYLREHGELPVSEDDSFWRDPPAEIANDWVDWRYATAVESVAQPCLDELDEEDARRHWAADEAEKDEWRQRDEDARLDAEDAMRHWTEDEADHARFNRMSAAAY